MFKNNRDRMFVVTFVLMVIVTTFVSPLIAEATVGEQPKENASYQLKDGVTEAIYSYADAIKETIYVESTLDSDLDGNPDRVAIDVIRPKETAGDLKVPIIMDASPYYESMGRGNESEIKDPDGDGINDMFPLYYDNYFVPRGYAVVQVDMVGTNNSDGCPTTGGYEEIESVKVVIDWLNGKGKAWDKDGQKIKADWSTGKVGMIGKSYDGTLANGVAAAGVEGLETIVPIGAISSWYDYYRYGGIPFYNNGPAGLSKTVTSSERVIQCAPVREEIRMASDDDTGNYNDFWDERNFVKDAGKVTASVFAVHGLNDYNVKANHFSNWWEALTENDVPRKLWLAQTGHVDPFDFRRDEWVHTLHQWFDYWLLDIDNGVMDEPSVDIERSADEWETSSSWPDIDAESVSVNLAPASGDLPGTLTTDTVIGDFTQSFIDNPGQTEKQMVEGEFTAKDNRLIYLSPELNSDIRLSGIPEFNIQAAIDKEGTNLTALIVDYGTDVRVNHRDRGEGIRTLDSKTCWGESTPEDNACYKETEKTTHEAPYEIVTKGWLDAQNRESLDNSNPLKPGQSYDFQWKALPEDYVFKEGHRIGFIITGSDKESLIPDDNLATFQILLGQSNVALPIVGGKEAFEKGLGYENGGTHPESAADMKALVQRYEQDGTIVDQDAAHALLTHLESVHFFEENDSAEKVVKHLNGLKHLIAYQKENKLILEEAYHVMRADTNYLIKKWK